MDIVTGAMNTLLPKLAELVVGEYKLQKGVKGEIKELEQELTSMTAALHKVAEVPPDQLDEQVKIWASEVREISYDIEDEVDTFMLRGKELGHTEQFSPVGLIRKATNLINKARTNHQIHNVVKDIMDQVKKVAERRDRYRVDNIAARPAMVAVDPRLEGMYRKATELVGIGRPKNELAKRLLEQDCSSSSSRQQSNIISIVGFGGLGKTTLANSLLQDLKAKFDCHVFVSVSLKPDIMNIFKNILLQLNDTKCVHKDEPWEMKQLIDRIIELLKNKKYFCVIDDLWNGSAWDTIKLAFQDGHPGSKIIITTRNMTVAEHVGCGVYELKPLSDDDSRKLLNKRIFDTDDGCPPSLREVTGEILKKCGGVPLAIITIASLLASKPMYSEQWEKVNKSIGSGLGSSLDVDKMRKILSLSYNDLPFHLKTCLLCLSKYPEDQVIRKDVLIWNWIAEGFIAEETQQPARTSLRDIGENYFSELVNRSLIQPVPVTWLVHSNYTELGVEAPACLVHDMLLELIKQLSAEEGFVTVLLSEDGQQASTLTSAIQKRKIRRLSLHNNSIEFQSYADSPEASREQLSKVRSLDIFGKVKSIPALSSFRVLRVLQVDDCSHLDNNHLNDLGKLRLLRFMRLNGLNVTKLPESIGELESLETLDIRGASSWQHKLLLPVSFAKLGRLVQLLADEVEIPDGLTLENMRCLQELVGILVTVHAMNEISELSKLKVLNLVLGGTPIPRGELLTGSSSISSNQLLIHKCLQRLTSLQDFVLIVTKVTYDLDLMADADLPCTFQRFVSNQWYLSFPRWINPSLSCLTVMSIILCDVCVLPEHLEKLAELPSLRFLRLCIDSFNSEQERLVSPSGASTFPCLTELQFECELMFLQFQHGAMRKLQRLILEFNARATNDWFPTNSFGYGLENLPSLRHVVVRIAKNKECPEAHDAIRNAVRDHPNHPSLNNSIHNM